MDDIPTWLTAVIVVLALLIAGAAMYADHTETQRKRRAFDRYMNKLREDAKIYGGG